MDANVFIWSLFSSVEKIHLQFFFWLFSVLKMQPRKQSKPDIGGPQTSGGGGSGGVSPGGLPNGETSKEFLSTGRTGRRNALPDILGHHADTDTADLPSRLEALTTDTKQGHFISPSDSNSSSCTRVTDSIYPLTKQESQGRARTARQRRNSTSGDGVVLRGSWGDLRLRESG